MFKQNPSPGQPQTSSDPFKEESLFELTHCNDNYIQCLSLQSGFLWFLSYLRLLAAPITPWFSVALLSPVFPLSLPKLTPTPGPITLATFLFQTFVPSCLNHHHNRTMSIASESTVYLRWRSTCRTEDMVSKHVSPYLLFHTTVLF